MNSETQMTRYHSILIVAASAALASAAPALAHVRVVSTSPGKSKTVKAPAAVIVQFTGLIRSGTLSVKGPGGRAASMPGGGRDPSNLTRVIVELKPKLRPGVYTARWSEIAADGHGKVGKFTFTVKS